MHNTPKIGLILGHQLSHEVQFIFREIERQGHAAIIIDTSQLASTVNIEFTPNNSELFLIIQGHKIATSQVSGVYWASVEPVSVKPSQDDIQSGPARILDDVLTNPNIDIACLLQLLFSETQLNWLNSFKAIQFHRQKPKQLSLAKSLGANIPATYVGNCPKASMNFLEEHPNTIVKPVFAGGLTKRVPRTIKSYSELQSHTCYPYTLQSFIPGEDIRSYIVGQFIVSAKVIAHYETHENANSADYRGAHKVSLIPFDLPILQQQLAIRIMRAFHMQYTAIDWRLAPCGTLYFLEANPAPLFVGAQQMLGVEIDRAIVDLMFA